MSIASAAGRAIRYVLGHAMGAVISSTPVVALSLGIMWTVSHLAWPDENTLYPTPGMSVRKKAPHNLGRELFCTESGWFVITGSSSVELVGAQWKARSVHRTAEEKCGEARKVLTFRQNDPPPLDDPVRIDIPEFGIQDEVFVRGYIAQPALFIVFHGQGTFSYKRGDFHSKEMEFRIVSPDKVPYRLTRHFYFRAAVISWMVLACWIVGFIFFLYLGRSGKTGSQSTKSDVH